jgi:Interferon-induced 6-16 family
MSANHIAHGNDEIEHAIRVYQSFALIAVGLSLFNRFLLGSTRGRTLIERYCSISRFCLINGVVDCYSVPLFLFVLLSQTNQSNNKFVFWMIYGSAALLHVVLGIGWLYTARRNVAVEDVAAAAIGGRENVAVEDVPAVAIGGRDNVAVEAVRAVAAAAIGGGAATGGTSLVAGLLGYTAYGISANSLAAAIMSMEAIAGGGVVGAGGFTATMQTIGAGGVMASPIGIPLAVGGAMVGGASYYWINRRNR